ncbi:hypothetical protein [Klebsiella pneumoniae]
MSLIPNSTSGYCGVNWHEPSGKWRARVKIDGKENYIGLFDDPQEAAIRIKAIRDAVGFHKNHGQDLRTEAERAIDEMVRLSGVSIGAAKILYDAGYRKG